MKSLRDHAIETASRDVAKLSAIAERLTGHLDLWSDSVIRHGLLAQPESAREGIEAAARHSASVAEALAAVVAARQTITSDINAMIAEETTR